jgi:polygalacturonase
MQLVLALFMLFFRLCSSTASVSTTVWKGIPDSPSAASTNTESLSSALSDLPPNGVLNIPNSTYYLTGGVFAQGLVNATIELDGALKFAVGRDEWPTEECKGGKQCVSKAILFQDVSGLTLTTSASDVYATVDGGGESWWGYINYLRYGEDRPKLITIQNGTDLLVERWRFRQAAYHTFHADDVARLEVRDCEVDNRFTKVDGHGPLNLRALNTDGFDVSGRDIWIHDSKVWNQDDCFTIVPLSSTGINSACTENVLVENVEASGLGLTVGSITPSEHHSCIKNITFRNAHMHKTWKGIYVKSASRADIDPTWTAEITNLLYENITMVSPEQVPIWIGPALQAENQGVSCSLAWPYIDRAKCPAPLGTVAWTNITLRNIRVEGARVSPGIVFGNVDSPMKGVVFDGVVFDEADEDAKPWGDEFYHCEGVEGIAKGGTWPVPPCFEVEE